MRFNHYIAAYVLVGTSIVYPGDLQEPRTAEKTEIVEIASSVKSLVEKVAAASTAPIIVPFNQALYAQCCEIKSDHFWEKLSINCMYVGMIGIPLIISFLYARSALDTFWQSVLFDKVTSVVKYGLWAIPAGLGVCMNMKAFGSHWKQFMHWSDRQEVTDVALKQKIWHREIWHRLGCPEIIGTIPTTGTYWLKCERAHTLMHETFDFDPFNAQHVKKIFLGFEDMRCKQITVQIPDNGG